MDKIVLFFLISLICLMIYRMYISVGLLSKKKNIIDEKFYVCFFYISIVDCIVFFSKSIVVGLILIGVMPIILTLYVALIPSRVYWIINGYDITDATFNNKIQELDEKYKNLTTLINTISFEHKRNEKKTKVIIYSKNYYEKEKILNEIKGVLKSNVVKSNKNEIIYLSICLTLFLILVFLIMIVLFT